MAAITLGLGAVRAAFAYDPRIQDICWVYLAAMAKQKINSADEKDKALAREIKRRGLTWSNEWLKYIAADDEYIQNVQYESTTADGVTTYEFSNLDTTGLFQTSLAGVWDFFKEGF